MEEAKDEYDAADAREDNNKPLAPEVSIGHPKWRKPLIYTTWYIFYRVVYLIPLE